MKIKMNGGEWVGEWSELVINNKDVEPNDFADALVALQDCGRAEMNFGAAGTVTLETI